MDSLQNITIKMLLEARSHSTAKIDGIENQKYGREYGNIPEVILAAQSIYTNFVDEFREGYDSQYLGARLGALLYAIDYEGEDYCMKDLKKDSSDIYQYLLPEAQKLASENNDNVDSIPIESILSIFDISAKAQQELDTILDKKKIPVKIYIGYDDPAYLYLDKIEYTGNDNNVKEWLQNTDKDKIRDLMECEGEIDGLRYVNGKNFKNTDSLYPNDGDHYGVNYNYKERNRLMQKAQNIKDQLAKTKNYNKSKELQAQLDKINKDINYRNSQRDRNIQNIKNRMNNNKK